MEEDTQVMGTMADFLVQKLTDEQEGHAFTQEYLKAGFLSAAVDALFYARRQAGLTQAQVAEQLNTKQAAIARLEADTVGAMSLHRYVEFALACGVVPLDIKLEPVSAVRDYVIENPESPRTQDLYEAWRKKHAEAIPVAQPPIGIPAYAAQTVITTPSSVTLSNQEGRLAVQWAERYLREQEEQNLKQPGYALSQWSGESATNTTSIFQQPVLVQSIA